MKIITCEHLKKLGLNGTYSDGGCCSTCHINNPLPNTSFGIRDWEPKEITFQICCGFEDVFYDYIIQEGWKNILKKLLEISE